MLYTCSAEDPFRCMRHSYLVQEHYKIQEALPAVQVQCFSWSGRACSLMKWRFMNGLWPGWGVVGKWMMWSKVVPPNYKDCLHEKNRMNHEVEQWKNICESRCFKWYPLVTCNGYNVFSKLTVFFSCIKLKTVVTSYQSNPILPKTNSKNQIWPHENCRCEKTKNDFRTWKRKPNKNKLLWKS